MTIDLRSDTVTKPCPQMLEAMMKAPLGDDVFNEDPTVIQLEKKLADMFEMEAGLFCPSGTMTNQIAINLHTRPGDEVLCDVNSHIYNYEGGGISKNSGVQAKLLHGNRGRLSVQQISENINGDFDWLCKTRLVSLENTVNRAGGSYYALSELEKISAFCKKNSLAFHLDGARIFNALVETGETPAQYGKLFDSVSVCLSKGLGSPAGSVLLGTKNFIKEARRVRKVFGGGMRQAGILAAAGIFALDNNIKRLKEDHEKAKQLEECLIHLPYIESVLPVDTNIVIFNLKETISGEQFEKLLAAENIKIAAFGKQTIRMVTHKDFTSEMLDVVLKKLRTIKN